ncbi:hypothetical protein BDV96DRAFT_689039 [Lophiotrema nucula]|uniref:Uncharacterized protein n=1 Tax=Lophiotrema nucula TaxID=690887 RepID=A0A6A5Z1S6_9PLEO|nr:hypothetical protein BDV96DRAFT_689039 [Lophiotrema nucula]
MPIVSWRDFINCTSTQYCERLSGARAFQRCYISQCGGIFAMLPVASDGTDADVMKLWAWVSEYVARYGEGYNIGFEDFEFVDLNHESFGRWGSFPVGLTVACEIAPEKVFSSNLTEKYLMPIWTSPNLPDYWSYKLEPDVIPEARSVQDLRKKIIGPYIFAATAFAHLLSITSTSTHLIVEVVNFAAFCLNPLLPAIQIVHNLVDAALLVFSGEAFEKSYLLAGIFGATIYEEGNALRETFRARLLEIDVIDLTPTIQTRDTKWWIRLIGIIVNLAFILYSTTPYFFRLVYTFKGASYTAATGFDHRLGWVSISALVPLIATLGLHLLNREWALRQGAQPNRNTGDWKARLALGLCAATYC